MNHSIRFGNAERIKTIIGVCILLGKSSVVDVTFTELEKKLEKMFLLPVYDICLDFSKHLLNSFRKNCVYTRVIIVF